MGLLFLIERMIFDVDFYFITLSRLFFCHHKAMLMFDALTLKSTWGY
jgi:hypothetical protein